ncbi:MAG TPA: glycosyltransferase [Schlesneria sp.]|jgi:hypothetical protein
MICTHKGPRLGECSIATQHECKAQQKRCVPTQQQLEQILPLATVPFVTCEGCPLFEATVSDTEATFAKLVNLTVPPKVSAICLAYDLPARLEALNEAVESFLRQTYPNKELVIVNDMPGMVIEFEHPQVRILNLPERCATLGDKYNAGCEAASGDLLESWDDDDISLPWRMEQSVAKISQQVHFDTTNGRAAGTAEYFNPQTCWSLCDGKLELQTTTHICHNAATMTKAAWEAAGRYPLLNGAQDVELDATLKATARTVLGGDPAYIHRTGDGRFHLSTQEDRNAAYADCGSKGSPGTYTLQPAWQQDYVELVRQESETVFSRIADRKEWGDGESISGPGSSLDATVKVRDELPALLADIAVASLLDIPCGDHNWMKRTDLQGVEYIGADVVRGIVDQNRGRFPGKRFEHLDLTADKLSKADAVFVRDCLVHLPYKQIIAALKNIVDSGATWLITTHFPGRTNHDIKIGAWRPLDLTAKPFGLPEPFRILNEGCKEGDGAFADKSLGVWRIADIAETVKKLAAKPRLSIGMATFRDWPGVWATIDALRLYHQDVWSDLEIIIIDNDPDGHPELEGNNGGESDHSSKCRRKMAEIGGKYLHYTEVQGTAAAKGKVFELATAPVVMVVDCHVFLPPGSIKRLIDFAESQPDSKDLWQGPCEGVGDYFAPRWGSLMYGQWANDDRTAAGEPFEIPMQGCGMFACNRKAWPGFHPLLRGFGPEEFHLHQRIRRNGGKCWCLPWMPWTHRFGNPAGTTPPGLHPERRLRGHIITHLDTGSPPLQEIRQHFVDEAKDLTNEQFFAVLENTVAEFWSDRMDAGDDCPHRQPFLRTEQCEIGCIATRMALPIFSCGLHGECAPWKWQKVGRKNPITVCVGCSRSSESLAELPKAALVASEAH